MPRPRALSFLALSLASVAAAHDGPVQLPPPASPAEAWNVLRLAGANVDELLPANLPRDVAAQLANIAVALPALRTGPGQSAVVARLAADTVAVLHATQNAADPAAAPAAWAAWKRTRGELAKLFPEGVVRADVYVCPMHPAEHSLKADAECDRCGMPLVRRRLPASAVYQKPGGPTLTITLRSKPLVVGERADVVLELATPDGKPVTPQALAVAHTQRIHLLINDSGLSDYHHEHPAPTTVPGEYAFAFTPAKPGPYRVWADVMPADSQVQEYDTADLPADTKGKPIEHRQTNLTAVADGLTFELAFNTAGRPLRAGEATVGTVTVSDPGGNGFTQLQPVMGAFAHLVGFHENGRDVLHIHPYGKSPTGDADRAGPAFAFKFYAPQPGLFRFYCQVQVGGRQVFAPFTINVEPAGTPASRPAGVTDGASDGKGPPPEFR